MQIDELEKEKDKMKERIKLIKSGKKPPQEEESSSESGSEGEDKEKKKKRKLPDDPEKLKKMVDKIDSQIAKWNTKKTEKVTSCFPQVTS
jgi:hypothetical protein